MRSATPDELKALKAASRQAVRAAGGGASFQHATRIREARISTCCSSADDLMDDFLPLDVALEADREAGKPIILELMARLQGFSLVPLSAAEVREGVPDAGDLLQVAVVFGHFLDEFARAGADRIYTEGEKRIIHRWMEKTVNVIRDTAARAGVGM